eukprot:3256794-Pyramimonas_sp.AAC.1
MAGWGEPRTNPTKRAGYRARVECSDVLRLCSCGGCRNGSGGSERLNGANRGGRADDIQYWHQSRASALSSKI